MTAAMGQARALFDSALTSETDECILWPYSTNNGYAQINIDRLPRLGHVIACVRRNGPRPPGMDAAHYCGNKGCINPRHLRWATRTILTVDQVREIRRRAGTCSNAALGREFGVVESAIRGIVNRRNWAWLDADEVAA